MKVPELYFDKYFTDVVGSPEATVRFKAHMRDAVQADPASPAVYQHLGNAIQEATRSAGWHPLEEPPLEVRQHNRFVAEVQGNAQTGIDLTHEGLWSIGDLIKATATAPQSEKVVAQNTDRALRYIYGLAYIGKLTANIQLNAIHQGRDPRSPLAQPAFWTRALFNRLPVEWSLHRAFTVMTCEASGQVQVAPKFSRAATGKKLCPATNSMLATAEGPKPALLTFMRAIGDVAVTEIFPAQFAMQLDTTLNENCG